MGGYIDLNCGLLHLILRTEKVCESTGRRMRRLLTARIVFQLHQFLTFTPLLVHELRVAPGICVVLNTVPHTGLEPSPAQGSCCAYNSMPHV